MYQFKNIQEGMAAWREDRETLAEKGLVLDGIHGYLPEGFKKDYNKLLLAMDAQPALSTLGNSGIPSFLSNWVDPKTIEVLFSANKFANIFGEEKKGDWTTKTAVFNMIEHTGEVSSYADFNENGSSGANVNWPQRQNYLFQTFVEWGELELENMGLAKINWVSQQNAAAALSMNKYQNLSYAYGIINLQNYGALNDPNLNAALTPAPKAYGGTAWIVNNVVMATANEIFTDIQTGFLYLVQLSNGLIEQEDKLTLALSPASAAAFTQTNAFNVNVKTLIKENFPNLTVKTAVQYGLKTSQNSQGNAAGSTYQLFADAVEGQATGTTAYSEKMRAHKIIPGSSSFRQKLTGGTWGMIYTQPFAVASMVGI